MRVLIYAVAALGMPALTGLSLLRANDVMTVADQLARQHLSYIYGSEDLHKGGLDCSGFVQIIFRESCGVELPDEADKQLEYIRVHGQVWDSTSHWTAATLQPGDLIFYAGPYDYSRISRITHVMVYCGHGTMVGAQGAGRRIDGDYSGVGYYPFSPRQPKGILGETGDRFLGHRQVFAYGRLTDFPAQPAHASVAAAPVPAPPPSAAKTVTASASSFNLKPEGINPRFD